MKNLISLFIIFATFLSAAFGKTVYVNANHHANGDGTSWSSPYTNLQTAVTASSAGDLVLVTNGVYSPITTGNKAITIQSVEGSSVTSIDGGGTTRCATLGTGVVLKGFTVFNGYTTGNGGGVMYGILTGCVISGNTAATCGGGSSGSTSYGCVYSNNVASRGSATNSGTHRDSLFVNNVATGAGTHYAGGGLYNCTMVNNWGFSSSSIGFGTRGGATSLPVVNCIIYNNTDTNGVVKNYDRLDKYSLTCTQTGSGVPVSGIGNLVDVDPQFTAPANDDFTLLPTSPCINKGANQYVTTATDLLGSPRIKDWRVDMGAYESQSTRFVTTPNALFPMGTKDVK